MRLSQQRKFLFQKMSRKQMLLKVRSRNRKRAFRRQMQGVPRSKVGCLHHRRYSPNQFLQERNKIHSYQYGDYCHVIAPSVLSLVQNREEVIHFINAIKGNLENKHKVFVVLDNVVEITDDAIVVLLSSMIRFRESHIDFNGSYPCSRKVADKLEKSGFFKFLFDKESEEFTVSSMDSSIYTHGYKRTDAVFASRMIEASSKVVWGEKRRCPGVQTTFTELMANTYKHASDTEGEHHWWVSMTKDYEHQKVVFGFVDYGVGIFRSLERKSPDDKLYGGLQKLWEKFPWADNNAKLMKLILSGELHKTATLQYNRGQGLPYISSCQKARAIDSLVIISNNVYADVKNDVYKLLDNEFIGTFVTWEMNSTIFNIK